MSSHCQGAYQKRPPKGRRFFLFKYDLDPRFADDDLLDHHVQSVIDFCGVGICEPARDVGLGDKLEQGLDALLPGGEPVLFSKPLVVELCEPGVDLLFAIGVAGEIPLAGEISIFETGELIRERSKF